MQNEFTRAEAIVVLCVIGVIALAASAKAGYTWAVYALLLIAILFVYGIIRSVILRKMQWSSGKEVGRFISHPKEDKLVCEGQFAIAETAPGDRKWCRVACEISVSGYASANEYSLQLLDATGTILHADAGELRPFLRFLWRARYGSVSKSWGKVALFEFVPPKPGQYRVTFRVDLDGVESVEIFVTQGVLPIEGKAYPHKRLVLSEAGVPHRTEDATMAR